MSLLCRALNDAPSSALQAILLRNNQVRYSYNTTKVSSIYLDVYLQLTMAMTLHRLEVMVRVDLLISLRTTLSSSPRAPFACAIHALISSISHAHNNRGTFGGESYRSNSDRPMAALTKLDISRNDIRVAGLALLTDALRDHAGFAKLIMVTSRCDIKLIDLGVYNMI
jgi:hypothetical protein